MTLIDKITEHLFGHKYYAVILNRRRERFADLSGFIFATRKEAEDFFQDTRLSNPTFNSVEIVTFRSRLHYEVRYNEDLHMRQTYFTHPADIPELYVPQEVRDEVERVRRTVKQYQIDEE